MLNIIKRELKISISSKIELWFLSVDSVLILKFYSSLLRLKIEAKNKANKIQRIALFLAAINFTTIN
jgi:hypothetical protein